jgi:hypothetical protein
MDNRNYNNGYTSGKQAAELGKAKREVPWARNPDWMQGFHAGYDSVNVPALGPKVDYKVWGWALIDGKPECIEFSKYAGDELLHSVNPNHDYMIDPANLPATKEDLINRQINMCQKEAKKWTDAIARYEAMKTNANT